ncbi:DNA mismatch repair endonuclease MutL [Rosenbergiella australiborealis]|uniref:DNA mismatch repair protein MutL n=2 Tax=Rosenbergiella TaxID=1356488 RepID=A0ABS5T2T2_9GAMM|nr:DNA mismatch repair endonuclease MutL [Rosenbergiella australiborealis]MBT0726048.1 DNA mismatch repair endonuclease MutL [Rosenbergiella australiborealis]
MPIQILPPQLANQIAAGEVVERPASVVKELIENSLDAGATRIHIEIDKGGTKRIAIRDNGYGIAKDQLELALARHATSKIASLDDLEAIMSLGFRGEALASISSVSRLTLTSRPENQNEAWQAYAEGREMNVSLKPAAHPRGSTLEVLDLFYNTPARRKFLRTEKTEFTHIDEVIRRIALARFDVEFILTHNGKQTRHYRVANNEKQKQQRLSAICGSSFVSQAVHIDWQHDSLGIEGWVISPSHVQTATEIQYCYVNGRMMRDKLINHAIRQAYQEHIGQQQIPAYVLFLTVDPHQVDVNVHPAKHEVRFHQSRLVHDFIYQGITSALTPADIQSVHEEHQASSLSQPVIAENRTAAGKNMFAQPSGSASGRHHSLPEPYRKKEAEVYQRLVSSTLQAQEVSRDALSVESNAEPLEGHLHSFGRVLTVCQQRFALLENKNGLALLALAKAAKLVLTQQLYPETQPLVSQPLLIPLRVKCTAKEKQIITDKTAFLQHFGIELHSDGQYSTLRAVPLPLRSQNLQILIPEMIEWLSQQTEDRPLALATWLAEKSVTIDETWTHSQAITLLADLERLVPGHVVSPPAGLVQPVDLDSYFEALLNE